MPAAAAGRSRLQTPSLAYANKQPNFAERIKTLRVVADNLLATAHLLSTFAQEVAADAHRRAAAAYRSAAGKGKTDKVPAYTTSPSRRARRAVKTTIPSLDGGDIQAAVAQAMLEYAAGYLLIARTEATTIRMQSRRPGRWCCRLCPRPSAGWR